MLTGNDLLKAVRELKKDLDTMKKTESSKTEMTIDGDCIIYNGVKYEKVKRPPSEQPFKLQYMFADVLENAIADLGYLGDFDNLIYHVDTLATHLLEGMTQHIPDYSDWEDGLKEFPERTLSEKDLDLFRLGWYAYCKKMWNMINDD